MTKPQLPKEVEEAYEEEIQYNACIYGHIANNKVKSFIAEQLEKQGKDILAIIANTRTITECYGIGKCEEQTRQQIIADIVAKIAGDK